MFNADLNGLYHREQVRDYIREAEQNDTSRWRPRRARKKAAIGFSVAVGSLALAWSLANLGQITAFLHLMK